MLAEIRARLIRNVMVIFITVVVTFLTTEYCFHNSGNFILYLQSRSITDGHQSFTRHPIHYDHQQNYIACIALVDYLCRHFWWVITLQMLG